MQRVEGGVPFALWCVRSKLITGAFNGMGVLNNKARNAVAALKA